jgi:hypothetical protein
MNVNVLMMINAAEMNFEDEDRYPIFVRRDSWTDTSVALVVHERPDWKQWKGEAPYWSTGETKWQSPQVFVIFGSSQGKYELCFLRSPGTYAYQRVAQPVWWKPARDQFEFGGLRITAGADGSFT